MKEETDKWSWKKRMKSFQYAFQGLIHMMKTQHNAWIHGMFAIAVIILSFYFKISKIEWLFIVSAIGLVFVTEFINTALETIVDIVSPEKQEKAGRAKDLAAGAVLVAAITALIVGLIIFIPRIF
jgi:diacylglycerol kinase (ATP)